jgi:hypothetical protein
MKKFLAIIAIAVMTAFTAEKVTAQTGPVKLAYGSPAHGDTAHASKTIFTPYVNLVYPQAQNLYVTIAVDSISGAPAGSFYQQHSVDGIHWKVYAGDTASFTNTGWTIRHQGLTPGDTNSNQTLVINQTPFVGNYVRYKLVTTSATQFLRYWITLKSANAAK